MENEKLIINHALYLLSRHTVDFTAQELGMMLKLLDKFPSYDWDKVIHAFMEDNETC